MGVRACVLVCAGVFILNASVRVCTRVCARARACVCVCVYFECVCVCVCVCVYYIMVRLAGNLVG